MGCASSADNQTKKSNVIPSARSTKSEIENLVEVIQLPSQQNKIDPENELKTPNPLNTANENPQLITKSIGVQTAVDNSLDAIIIQKCEALIKSLTTIQKKSLLRNFSPSIFEPLFETPRRQPKSRTFFAARPSSPDKPRSELPVLEKDRIVIYPSEKDEDDDDSSSESNLSEDVASKYHKKQICYTQKYNETNAIKMLQDKVSRNAEKIQNFVMTPSQLSGRNSSRPQMTPQHSISNLNQFNTLKNVQFKRYQQRSLSILPGIIPRFADEDKKVHESAITSKLMH